jgi:hypothetical protein
MKGKKCIDKKRFNDRISAQKKADIINKGIMKMRVYQCELCDYYHLTSVSRGKFQKLQKRQLPENVTNEANYWINKLTK